VPEPDTGEAKGRPVRLLYRIIVYVAIWIVALLLTAPSLWPLAWMFPLGLLGLIILLLGNVGGCREMLHTH